MGGELGDAVWEDRVSFTLREVDHKSRPRS